MSNDKYYAEDKYRCNHPESDFEKTSTNPIEMKQENFIEYTRRNETANYRYDVWGKSESIETRAPQNRNIYTNTNNNNTQRKNVQQQKKSGCRLYLCLHIYCVDTTNNIWYYC